jgi:hypothetical protein
MKQKTLFFFRLCDTRENGEEGRQKGEEYIKMPKGLRKPPWARYRDVGYTKQGGRLPHDLLETGGLFEQIS